MKQVPLSRGMVALVDAEDFERVSRYKWHVTTTRKNKYCAARTCRVGKKRIRVWLHHFILNATCRVDHKNNNGLDNRKTNLRTATDSQNKFNVPKRTTNTSGYKGVFFTRTTGRWSAQIGAHWKTYHLGYYDTPEQAARAYDKAAKEKHGEFARTNF